jgi:hypothetical protein
LKLTNSELARASAEAAQRGALPQYQGDLTQALDTEIGTKAPKVRREVRGNRCGRVRAGAVAIAFAGETRGTVTTSQHANTVAWLLSNPNALQLS